LNSDQNRMGVTTMLSIIKTMGKLLVNTVVVIAYVSLFVFVYIMVLLSELGSNKPKLTVH